jgi:hypothetical protein
MPLQTCPKKCRSLGVEATDFSECTLIKTVDTQNQINCWQNCFQMKTRGYLK